MCFQPERCTDAQNQRDDAKLEEPSRPAQINKNADHITSMRCGDGVLEHRSLVDAALVMGMQVIEADVRTTQNGTPILIHDVLLSVADTVAFHFTQDRNTRIRCWCR